MFAKELYLPPADVQPFRDQASVSRLGNYLHSKVLLEDAIKVADRAGDLEGAGRAKLSIIEELSERTRSGGPSDHALI